MKLATAFVTSILSLTTLDARAAAPHEAYSIKVTFADLDLSRQAGIATLYSRIKSAARRVCDQQANEQLVAKQTYRVCVERAVATAAAHVDRPMLKDYMVQRGGRPAKTAAASIAAR